MTGPLPGDVPAVVVGGGQAGLAVSHELSNVGVEHMVLEADRVGASWAGLWDSFRLNTPNWSVRLPGHPYDRDEPDDFMTKAETVAYLERYAGDLDAVVHEGVRVRSLDRAGSGFALETTAGSIGARSAIVCTGAYQRSFRPRGADTLPDALLTMDTRTYRSPDGVPDGVILVVGSGQSGCQIAEELADAGRDVVLACGKAAWMPRRIGGRDAVWWALETGFLGGSVDSMPGPAARLAANVTISGVGGGHDLHPRTLQTKGVTLAGRFEGCDGDRVTFAGDLAESIAWSDARCTDMYGLIRGLCVKRGIEEPDLPFPAPFVGGGLDSLDVASLGAVVFAGGFRPDYDWINIPGAVDEMGFPVQRDGACTASPGLFFAGVHFLRTRKSSLLCGVGEDAAIVADGVAAYLSGRG